MAKKESINNDSKKITNENPVSLSPLNFKEALTALLKIKPETKDKKKTTKEKTGI